MYGFVEAVMEEFSQKEFNRRSLVQKMIAYLLESYVCILYFGYVKFLQIFTEGSQIFLPVLSSASHLFFSVISECFFTIVATADDAVLVERPGIWGEGVSS